MLTTTNFKLKKPESTDYAKISDLNDNADIIDAEIAKRPTRDDMDDVIDTKFTTSTSRAKLTPGEKLKVLFGKIERWLEDLKDGAFSTVVNNVNTTDAGFVLDARQGKALKDQIDTKANKADVVNNLTTTDYGYILDARQGKALNDKINDAKSSLDASIATKLASANIVNNVTTTDTGYALDARQGKALNDKIDSTKSSLQSSFQAGVDGIYSAITAQGTTPASKSQGDVKNAIGTLATSKYSQGKNDVSLSVSGSYVNASNGKSARVNYKGQFYRNEGNNVGLAGDYFHATFPEGYYGSEGQAWAPEIRVPVGTMNANGWYDQDQYNAHYNAGYNAGKSVTVAKLSAIKISANRGVAPKGDGAQGAGASGTFTIDTSNYSSAWLGAVEIYKMRSYVDATMTIKSNSGSVLFSLSTYGDGEKTGGNVTLNLSGVSSITITINPAIYDNALNSSDSYGYIDSLTFAA